jgi:hypothetical protein
MSEESKKHRDYLIRLLNNQKNLSPVKREIQGSSKWTEGLKSSEAYENNYQKWSGCSKESPESIDRHQ